MSQLARLIAAISLMALSYVCFIHAPVESSSDNSILAIYILLSMAIGFIALSVAILGGLFLFSASLYAFWIQLTVFIVSNFLLVLVVLLHALFVFLFLFDTLLGRISFLLDLLAVAFVISSAPKRT